MGIARLQASDEERTDGEHSKLKWVILFCTLLIIAVGVTPLAAAAQSANNAPTARNDRFTATEDQKLTVRAPGVLSNDSDADRDRLSAVLHSDPNHGTLDFNADGSFTYTPEKDFEGTDSFTYKAADGKGGASKATVNITVRGVNDAPVAADDDYRTERDMTLRVPAAIGVLKNDTDAERDNLFAARISDPKHGTLDFDRDGSFIYTPEEDFEGTDSFTYEVSDRSGTLGGGTDTATVTITVVPPNEAPVADDDSYQVDEDGTLNVPAPGVLDGDTDAENDPLTAVKVSDPANGQLTLNADGSFTYEPDDDFFGEDSFTYKANDGEADSNTATVTITVNATNDTPDAVDDMATADEDTPTGEIDVLSNDTGLGDAPISVTIETQGAKGTATVNANNTITYTPNADANGSDSFVYEVCDGDTTPECDTATVQVEIGAVSDQPQANDDGSTADPAATTDEDTPTGEIDVLSNDTGLGDAPISVTIETQGAKGTATVNANNTITYTPNADANGSDSFVYEVCDGDTTPECDTATVNVEITSVNDDPDAVDDNATTDEDTDKGIDVLANDTGLGDTPLTVSISSQGTKGTATVNANNTITYTPNADANGSDSFVYEVCDGDTTPECDTATVNVEITSVNDDPDAVDDNATTDEDIDKVIDVLANDTIAPDTGETLSVQSVTDPAHGTASLITTGPDAGKILYQPEADYNGSDTFEYTISDGNGGAGAATVNVTVNPVNGAPVNTVPQGQLSAGEGEDLEITGISTSDIDAGDGDIKVTLSVTGGANNGTLALNNGTDENTTDDNIVVITGTVDEVNAILDGGLTYDNSTGGSYTLTVETDDQGNTGSGGAKTDTDTVGIIVDAAPEVTTTTPADGDTDVAPDGNITINFSEDVNAVATSFELKCPATGSAKSLAVTGSGTGAITLNPDSDLPGATECQVRVIADQVSDTDTNDPPDNMAADHTFTFTTAAKAIDDDYSDDFTVVGNVSFDSQDAATPFGVLDNDETNASTQVTTSDATSAQGGDVTVRADGTFEYDPPAGYEGLDSFTYTVTGGSTAEVTLRVGGMIWFVDEDATTSGDGRLSSPFDTLSAFNDVNGDGGNNPAAGDNIFLYESTTKYVGPVTLLNNQRLIGQDATSSLATITNITRPSGSASFPTMSTVNPIKTTITTTAAASTNGVNVGSGNTLRGFTVGDTTGSDINGSSFGTLRVTDVSLTGAGQALNLTTGTLTGGGFDTLTSTSGTNNVSLTNVGTSGTPALGTSSDALSGASSDAFKVSGGNGSFSYSGSISNANTLAANIENKTGGTVTLSGDINPSTAGKGISVSGNTAGTITFSGSSKKFAGSSGTLVDLGFPNASTATVEFTNGGLDVAGTSSAVGFKAAGVDGNDGAVKVQGSGNVVSTATGRALDVQHANIGAPAAGEGGLNFRSISANGASNGIVLNNTGTSGGLTVTGNGGSCTAATPTCTGGTIRNTTGDGISLANTRNVSLDRMMIQNSAANGIRGTSSVTNFTLANSTLLDNASDPPGGANDEANIRFDGLFGTASISGSEIAGADEDQIRIFNNSGTLGSLTVQNNNIHDTATAGLGNQAVNLEASGSADITSTFSGGTYARNYAGDIKATTNGSASMDTTVSGITAGNNGNGGVSVETSHNSSGDYDFDITGNTITGNTVPNSSSGILVNKGTDGTGTQSGTISGNTVDLNNSTVGPGIFVASNGTGGTLTVDINNNRVREVSNYGIQAIARQGNSTLNATIRNNPEISTSGSAPLNAIDVQAGASSTTDTVTVCADVAGNTASTTGGSGVFAITFVQLRLSHLRIEGYTGAANNEGAIETFLASQNTVSSGHAAPHVDMEFVGTPQDTTGVTSCPTP